MCVCVCVFGVCVCVCLCLCICGFVCGFTNIYHSNVNTIRKIMNLNIFPPVKGK